MLNSPITVTIGADTGLEFRRVNQDGYSSEYYAISADGSRRYTMSVKHTLPPKGSTGESHLLRLDCEHYDAEAKLLRTESSWTVMKTVSGLQNNATMASLATAVHAVLSADTNAVMSGILLRES